MERRPLRRLACALSLCLLASGCVHGRVTHIGRPVDGCRDGGQVDTIFHVAAAFFHLVAAATSDS